MKEKTISLGRRGLTFSFPSVGRLGVGARYDYILDKEKKAIRIVPSLTGKYKMSRKRSGDTWLSLVDLRNREVMDALTGMTKLRVSFTEDEIIIRDASVRVRKSGMMLRFPRAVLENARKAAGMGTAEAVSALTENVQMTFDDLFREMDVSTVHQDLQDVYTLVSLFSGAGVLDWPFCQDSRFDLRYAIDYEASACETYRQNIGTHIVHGDIHKAFTEHGYPLDQTVHDPDIILGGPSCKPFSNANRHTRLADHPDSDLVVQYMRVVKALRPKVFAMENVPEVLTACDGAYYQAIKDVAAECGYQLDAKIVRDDLVGGYTTRKRAVIIGSRVGPVRFRDLTIASGRKTVGDALSKITPDWPNYGDVTLPSPDVKKRMSFVPQGGNYEAIPPEYRTGSKNRHSCTYRRLAWNEAAPTIVNWRKPPLIHPLEDRTLTVAEAKALQGLPGHFRVCGSLGQKQQQIGNSVPVSIGTYIKETLLSILQAGDKPQYATI